MDDYGKILFEIKMLRGEISMIDMSSHTIDGWVPRKFVMKFFDLGDTTMNSLEKSGKLTVSKVGRRKFYDINSIKNLLHMNKTSK